MRNFLNRFLNIIDKNLRTKLIFLTLLMFFGTFIELFGIALVIPVLAIIVENNILELYPFLSPLINHLGNPSKILLVLYAIYLLALVYLLKVIFLTYLNWKQSKFVFDVESYATEKLFSVYLKLPYTFHLNNNSSLLLRNVTTEVSMLSSSMTALTSLLIEILIVIGVVIFLIFIEPLISFIVFIIVGIINLLFYFLTKKLMTEWGENRQIFQGSKFQNLQQGFGAIKDIKIYGREDYFIESYQISNRNTLKMDLFSRFINSLPRLWMELLAAISIAILISIFIFEDRDLKELIPTIGLFMAAAFRIMPSFNRIINSLQTMRFSLPALEIINSEMNLADYESANFINSSSEKIPEFRKSIDISNVSFCYPNSDKQIIKSANFKIPKGSSVGFIGETGSGKSTLLNIIIGLLQPSEGEVLLDGINVKKNMRRFQNLIGFVPQNIFLSDDTIANNIAFGISHENIDKNKIKQSLKAANILDFVESSQDGLNMLVGEAGIRLSGGQKQRIGIARALYHDPSILVFDEATSALDVETEENVMNDVSKLVENKTLLIISHRITTLSRCNKIFKIDKNGSIKEVNKETNE